MSKKKQAKKTLISPKGQVSLPASTLGKLLNVAPEKVSEMRLARITEEFAKGFEFLKNYGKSATFFGSARYKEGDEIYEEARKLAFLLSKDNFAVITGGGPGIMEAANRGASEAGGQSAGINIQLDGRQRTNPYVKDAVSFHYFFVRKVMLAFASEVCIFFPGGFGTLDEFFELVMLVQTRKITPIPIVLIGKSFWNPLLKWVEEDLYEKRRNIDREDMKIYHLVKDAKEAHRVIRKFVKGDNIRMS